MQKICLGQSHSSRQFMPGTAWLVLRQKTEEKDDQIRMTVARTLNLVHMTLKIIVKYLKVARLERQEKPPISIEKARFLIESGFMALGKILIFLFFLYYLCR